MVTNDGKLMYNEPNHYLAGRIITPPEAYWRIRGYPTHFRTHTVVRLQVGVDAPMLLGFFDVNRQSPNLTFTYTEFGVQYRWVQQGALGAGKWILRTRESKVVARMYDISPYRAEDFALRSLLLKAKAPTSFNSLKLVNNVRYTTFVEAAKALGLLMNDQVWIDTFQDLAPLNMPAQLRRLLVNMVANQMLTDVAEIWDQFKDDFAADYLRRYPQFTNDQVHEMARREILRLLSQRNMSNVCNLPGPIVTGALPATGDGLNAPAAPAVVLNPDQQAAYDAVIQAVLQRDQLLYNTQRLFLIIGPAGTGKTTLYKVINILNFI